MKNINSEEKFISVEEIQDYFFNSLIKAGLVPQGGDIEIIAEIIMNFMSDMGIVDIEYDDEEYV